MLEQMKVLEDQLEEQDNEIKRLRGINAEIGNKIYHADRHDKIDMALG